MTRECGTGSPPVAGSPLPCPVSWGEGAPAIASWSVYRDAEYADRGIRAAFHPFVPAAGEGGRGFSQVGCTTQEGGGATSARERGAAA